MRVRVGVTRFLGFIPAGQARAGRSEHSVAVPARRGIAGRHGVGVCTRGSGPSTWLVAGPAEVSPVRVGSRREGSQLPWPLRFRGAPHVGAASPIRVQLESARRLRQVPWAANLPPRSSTVWTCLPGPGLRVLTASPANPSNEWPGRAGGPVHGGVATVS